MKYSSFMRLPDDILYAVHMYSYFTKCPSQAFEDTCMQNGRKSSNKVHEIKLDCPVLNQYFCLVLQ